MMTNSVLVLVMLLGMTLMLTKRDQVSATVDDLFTKYDQNGDGLVSPVEIENQLDVAIVTGNNYVFTCDKDNDGNLNRKEFIEFAKIANLQTQDESD